MVESKLSLSSSILTILVFIFYVILMITLRNSDKISSIKYWLVIFGGLIIALFAFSFNLDNAINGIKIDDKYRWQYYASLVFNWLLPIFSVILLFSGGTFFTSSTAVTSILFSLTAGLLISIAPRF